MTWGDDPPRESEERFEQLLRDKGGASALTEA